MSDRLRGLAIGGCDATPPLLILVAIPTRRTRDLEPELPEDVRPGLAPLDEEVDHASGPTSGRLILEYGDYECPYSRQAFRAIEGVERELSGQVRFAFRHFPLVQVHPNAFGAAAAAEAAGLQDGFWAMHERLFQSQQALQDDDLRQYAEQLGLDVARFDEDRVGPDVRRRIRRDVETGLASADVRSTPTLFIDGVVYVGGYDASSLIEALSRNDRPT
jgi:protein-disulfide isomerase